MYIVTVTRHSNLSFDRDSSYIDLIFEKEENAWKRIEDRYYSMLDCIKNNGMSIRMIDISEYYVFISFEDPSCNYSSFIRYDIIERDPWDKKL